MSVALNVFPHTRVAYSGKESHWVSLAAVEWTLEKVPSGMVMKTPTVSLTKAELASLYIWVRSSCRVYLGGSDELAQAAQIALAGVFGREEHVGQQAGEQVMGLVVEVDISAGSGPGAFGQEPQGEGSDILFFPA